MPFVCSYVNHGKDCLASVQRNLSNEKIDGFPLKWVIKGIRNRKGFICGVLVVLPSGTALAILIDTNPSDVTKASAQGFNAKNANALETILLIVSFSVIACARKNSLDALDAEFSMLYQKGLFPEATKVVEQAMKEAEEIFGPEHLKAATYMNNLAQLYYFQGNYDDAALLYKRSLAIREKHLGEDLFLFFLFFIKIF
ncbi:MAG: tetratricopeptide repeat protein [bacterium]